MRQDGRDLQLLPVPALHQGGGQLLPGQGQVLRLSPRRPTPP